MMSLVSQMCIRDRAYQDAVMYTLHVRGFSIQPGSGVRHRGTFKGVQEKAEYLKELGINQVKLMPAYEFEEIIRPSRGVNSRFAREGEQVENTKVNYWGYGPGYYFAPKAAYAATAHPAKEMCIRDRYRPSGALSEKPDHQKIPADGERGRFF